MYYDSLDHAIETAVNEEWINESDATRLRNIIVYLGHADRLVETGVTVDGADLYSICADYL